VACYSPFPHLKIRTYLKIDFEIGSNNNAKPKHKTLITTETIPDGTTSKIVTPVITEAITIEYFYLFTHISSTA